MRHTVHIREQDSDMQYAAHIREQDGGVQTVQEHCIETAKLAVKYGERLGTANLATISGLLHDVGKLTPQFNEYVRGSGAFHRGDIDHSYAGAKYICEKCDEMGAEYYDVSRFIARLIVSHHGLHDWAEFDGSDYLSARIQKNEYYENVLCSIHEIVCNEKNETLEELVNKANEEYQAIKDDLQSLAKRFVNSDSQNRKTAYAFYMGMFERLLQSVLIDADRTNTAEFMMQKRIEHEYDAEELFRKFYKNIEQKAEDFLKRKDRISRQRSDISERCKSFAEHDVGICQLIVPTGGGKTLSSLRFAIEYCRSHKMERIIYVAPFMSILEQNSDEIRQIVGNENFLEHHSNAMQEIETREELEKYELYTEKWDMPVIATTMVQFLNTLFLGKTSSVRRMHRLSRTVIIIDEIQSLPLKCVNLFNLAMNFLKEVCGSTIVLCSATQPDFTNSKYPILLDNDSQMTGDYEEDFKVFKRTEIIPSIDKYGYTFEQAANFCYERFRENRSLLVIVNTKASARKMFALLSEINERNDENKKAVIVHLSTNMCPAHRKDKLLEIRRLLKCEASVICVTTQLIEAGVDISFGSVVRFMAGLDNVAQAAGRCNRNGEQSKTAPVYVINVRDEKLGSLSEIEQAQRNAQRIFGSEKIKDYLSVETMQCYFRMLYNEQSDKLSYAEKDEGVSTTLLKLLSTNSDRRGVNRNSKLKYYSSQAFKTAGTLFRVIDNNTRSIIVPYNEEAKDIMLRLNSSIDMSEIVECLRKVQKYMVEVHGGMFRKLETENAVFQSECGALELKEEYYHLDFGIDLEGAEQEVLIF